MSTPRDEWRLVDVKPAILSAFRHLKDCSDRCDGSRASKLVTEAGNLATAAVTCKRLLQSDGMELPGRDVSVATCITKTGALPALAKVADHLQSLLQQPQQLNKQQLMKLFGSGVAVITLVTVTSAIWPQNVLLAKAFEPILCPWVSLSAALLAVLGNPETSQLLWQNAGAFLQAVSNTASSISYIVNSSPRGPSMGLIPPTEAASKFCLSDELQQLLVFQLAVIAHAKHHRYKGVPPIALPLSSRATGSSSSSNQQPQEGQGGQQVQPYHERLLRDLGLQYWKIPKEMIKTLESGDHLGYASAAMGLTSAYRREKGLNQSVTFRITNWLPVLRTDGTIDPFSQEAAAADNSTSPSSSSQPWSHSLLLVMIECIALDDSESDFDNVSLRNLLQPLLAETGKAAVADGTGCLMLPRAAAGELLQAVLQMVAPAMIHQLRGTAALSADRRMSMLSIFEALLIALIGQAPIQDLADCFTSSPLATAVALEAAFRARVGLPAKGSGSPADLPTGVSSSALKAPPLLYYTYRVVLALYSNITNELSASHACGSTSGSSTKTPAALEQQPIAVAQLLLTCLKCVGTAIAMCQHLTADDYGAALAQGLQQALLTVHLLCSSNNSMEQSASSTAVGQSGTTRAATGCNGFGSSSMPQQEAALWAVLTARSLEMLTSTAAKAHGSEYLDPLAEEQVEISFRHVLVTARQAVSRLGVQLADIGSLPPPPAVGGASSSSGLSGAPGAKSYDGVISKLLVQQQATLQVLGEWLAGTAISEQHSKPPRDTDALSASTGSTTSSSGITLNWVALQQQLEDFCTAVCAALPLSSCCNNPACLNMEKLSEQQLTGGKGCICAGCGVARYCGRDCQAAHWQQHKAVCKVLKKQRLQQQPISAGNA